MRTLIAACACLILCGCGFTPVYGSGLSGGSTANVQVEQIDGRYGHILRKILMRELAAGLPGLEGTATVSVSIDEELDRLTFRPDQAAARTDALVSANYILATEDNAWRGGVNAETAYNVPNAPYADITAQIDAQESVMRVIARKMVADMRLQLAETQ